MVLDAAVHHLGVAHAASARHATLDGLHRPVVPAALGVRETAGGAALPLLVVRRTAAATAQDVRAPVARTLRGGTLRHDDLLVH